MRRTDLEWEKAREMEVESENEIIRQLEIEKVKRMEVVRM